MICLPLMQQNLLEHKHSRRLFRLKLHRSKQMTIRKKEKFPMKCQSKHCVFIGVTEGRKLLNPSHHRLSVSSLLPQNVKCGGIRSTYSEEPSTIGECRLGSFCACVRFVCVCFLQPSPSRRSVASPEMIQFSSESFGPNSGLHEEDHKTCHGRC